MKNFLMPILNHYKNFEIYAFAEYLKEDLVTQEYKFYYPLVPNCIEIWIILYQGLRYEKLKKIKNFEILLILQV